jgi:pyruvate dehydrogenase (quinone)
LHASEEVKELAEITGGGVAKALLGRTVLSDYLPYVTGSIGLLGTKPTYDMMMQCDTFLMIGSSFPYPEFLPKEGSARGIQIDIDGRMLSIRYPMELNLKGDAKATLQALNPLLKYKEDRSWREELEKEIEDWWAVLESKAMNSANPVNPQRVFFELSSRLPGNVILTADSGSVANWFARNLKLKETMMASLSGNLATMGSGVPYAIAAKFAYPERPVIALVGDGAMQMNGNESLITVAKYWKEWKDPRLVVMVLNNQDLNLVTWEQRVMEGDPKFEASQNLPDFPYAGYAKSIGLHGIRVDDPDELGRAWDEVLKADRPTVLEVVTDPEVPPIPPHITFEQAVSYTKALFKGDPNRGKMIIQAIKDKASEYFK